MGIKNADRNVAIGWSENCAAAGYVDRKGCFFGEVAGYITISKNRKNYSIAIAGADGISRRILRLPAENSMGLAMLSGEIYLRNMLEERAA